MAVNLQKLNNRSRATFLTCDGWLEMGPDKESEGVSGLEVRLDHPEPVSLSLTFYFLIDFIL